MTGGSTTIRSGSERVFGLDAMRAAAILLVVFWHSKDLLEWIFPTLWFPPYMEGVDLFFVLSGYLIGGILLKYVAMDEVPVWRRLLDFWQRRWLRTLPNYYLFLLVNVLLAMTGVTGGLINHHLWVYVFFLQNIWRPMDLFFWESWSLVVEEWYYVLFPAALFGALVLLQRRPRRIFLLVALVFIVAPTIVRFILADEARSIFAFEQGARKLLITRLDTIGWGMLAAWLQAAGSAQWMRVRMPLLLLGLLGMCANAMAYGNGSLFYSTTWFYTVNAIVMASLLPFLSTWKNAPTGGSVVVFISTISYSLYLVHQPVRAVWNRLLWDHVLEVNFLGYVIYWVACIGLAWLVYRFWERRFMCLRDRVGKRVLGSSIDPSS